MDGRGQELGSPVFSSYLSLVSLSVLKNDEIYITRDLRLNVATDEYHDSASKYVFKVHDIAGRFHTQ
jgi:hypothetical protein